MEKHLKKKILTEKTLQVQSRYLGLKCTTLDPIQLLLTWFPLQQELTRFNWKFFERSSFSILESNGTKMQYKLQAEEWEIHCLREHIPRTVLKPQAIPMVVSPMHDVLHGGTPTRKILFLDFIEVWNSSILEKNGLKNIVFCTKYIDQGAYRCFIFVFHEEHRKYNEYPEYWVQFEILETKILISFLYRMKLCWKGWDS